jgi:hypothetical protein
MKNFKFLITAIAVIALWACSPNWANAQTNPERIYHVTTWYMIPELDSTQRAERDALLKEYLTKVTMKNEFVIHQWNMTHFFTDDSREFLVITEMASLADIEKAFDRDEELEKQAWPDAQKRRDFLKKMNSYFTHHKDAIFNGLPALTK